MCYNITVSTLPENPSPRYLKFLRINAKMEYSRAVRKYRKQVKYEYPYPQTYEQWLATARAVQRAMLGGGEKADKLLARIDAKYGLDVYGAVIITWPHHDDPEDDLHDDFAELDDD